MEAPSDASKKWVHKKANNLLPQKDENKISYLKQKEGLLKKAEEEQIKRKKNGPKNPNPLSCKKSKKQKQAEQQHQHNAKTSERKEHKIDDKSKTGMKPKRKRIKLPSHVKEVLKNK